MFPRDSLNNSGMFQSYTVPKQRYFSMTQTTFAEAEFANRKRKNRREIFLEWMEKYPWAKLEKKLRSHYPRGGNGRPP